MLKTNSMVLDFLLNNIMLNIDVFGSITLLIVIGVLYCWLIVSVYLKWFFYIVDHSKSRNKFLKPFCMSAGLITSNKLHIHRR
jgi:type III secretory pathway component EscU